MNINILCNMPCMDSCPYTCFVFQSSSCALPCMVIMYQHLITHMYTFLFGLVVDQRNSYPILKTNTPLSILQAASMFMFYLALIDLGLESLLIFQSKTDSCSNPMLNHCTIFITIGSFHFLAVCATGNPVPFPTPAHLATFSDFLIPVWPKQSPLKSKYQYFMELLLNFLKLHKFFSNPVPIRFQPNYSNWVPVPVPVRIPLMSHTASQHYPRHGHSYFEYLTHKMKKKNEILSFHFIT